MTQRHRRRLRRHAAVPASTCSSTWTSTTRSTSPRSTSAGRGLPADDVWSQLIIKETDTEVELLTAAPKTGIWRLDDEGTASVRALGERLAQPDRRGRGVLPARAAPGEYRYKGADLGVLVARGRMQTDDNQLTERCRQWVKALRAEFVGVPAPPAESYDAPMAFKSY